MCWGSCGFQLVCLCPWNAMELHNASDQVLAANGPSSAGLSLRGVLVIFDRVRTDESDV